LLSLFWKASPNKIFEAQAKSLRKIQRKCCRIYQTNKRIIENWCQICKKICPDPSKPLSLKWQLDIQDLKTKIVQILKSKSSRLWLARAWKIMQSWKSRKIGRTLSLLLGLLWVREIRVLMFWALACFRRDWLHLVQALCRFSEEIINLKLMSFNRFPVLIGLL